MFPGADADDMVRRGFLSSLMPFRRKSLRPAEQIVRSHAPPPHRPSVSLPQAPPPQPVPLPIPSPVHPHPHHHHHVPPVPMNAHLPCVLERTQHDIFREIVSECAQLERSNTTTPFSDLGSAPTSPLTPMAPAPSPVASLSSPMGAPSQGFLYDQLPPPNYAPPPYPAESHIYPHPPGYGIPPIMVTTSPNPQMPNALLLEEVVKMVVSAMSQSSLGDPTKENPEDILRRKRNQNNEAAARYRKRQRAARQRAEEELALLSKRNDDLRTTVNHMEGEIQQLKEMVLTKKDS